MRVCNGQAAKSLMFKQGVMRESFVLTAHLLRNRSQHGLMLVKKPACATGIRDDVLWNRIAS